MSNSPIVIDVVVIKLLGLLLLQELRFTGLVMSTIIIIFVRFYDFICVHNRGLISYRLYKNWVFLLFAWCLIFSLV